MYLRNGKIGVLDLSTGDSSEVELPEGQGWDDFSSISIARRLSGEQGPDALILGTGVLTASFVPSSCAGVVHAGGRTMPFMGHAGVELKLSGFDFIVLKGRAPGPGYVWIRDGSIDLVESPELLGKSSWARTDKVRADQGDTKIQVIASGPWCDASSEASQLVVDYWGGDDKVSMGAEFGKRNLVAVAFRGMGEVELAEPEGHFQDAMVLMGEHVTKLGSNYGLESYFDGVARKDFRALVHRSIACYGCPFPCRTYLKTDEEPGEMKLVVKEPGYLHYDIPALKKAFEIGMDARSATLALVACAKVGAEPVSVLSALGPTGAGDTLEAVSKALSASTSITKANAPNFEASFQDLRTYETCLGLGLCPRYWARAGFTFEDLSEYAVSALGSKIPKPG